MEKMDEIEDCCNVSNDKLYNCVVHAFHCQFSLYTIMSGIWNILNYMYSMCVLMCA